VRFSLAPAAAAPRSDDTAASQLLLPARYRREGIAYTVPEKGADDADFDLTSR